MYTKQQSDHISAQRIQQQYEAIFEIVGKCCLQNMLSSMHTFDVSIDKLKSDGNI